MPELSISGYDVTLPVREGENILSAITRAGHKYRYGCRRGGCGVCKVHLVLGEVEYERPIDPRVLTDEERVLGICLSCRAVPLTNVVIELQAGDQLRGGRSAQWTAPKKKATARFHPRRAADDPGGPATAAPPDKASEQVMERKPT